MSTDRTRETLISSLERIDERFALKVRCETSGGGQPARRRVGWERDVQKGKKVIEESIFEGWRTRVGREQVIE